jgi:hypothetical protein
VGMSLTSGLPLMAMVTFMPSNVQISASYTWDIAIY